ncbi:alpha-1,2-fucosyltransferase [Chitinophaga sp.]|uniref:alpha-1,2-fucosyltransferase n=1 Tax=Chitinophaga sp. TaxID=1869181 RepID=UPI002608424B|nr:alpha-1,2-fucosyltransferase [uncultured Chitinophaga sp.]
MITLLSLFGQTSNNYLQHIHLDAFCRTNGIRYFTPRMRRYYGAYPNLAKAGYGSSKLYMKMLHMLSFKPVIQFDDETRQADYERQLLEPGNHFVEGWWFRMPDEVIAKYAPLYREHFRPGFSTHWLDKDFLRRPNGEALIAVHVRRGDFKTWAGGIYYYGDDVYIDKIRQLTQQLDRPAKIILFTNDPDINLPLYRKACKNVLLSGHGVAEDHYLMSQCDYIIGPFSTFSLWASFIGEKPFQHIHSEEEMIAPDKFRVFGGNW